MNAKTVRWIVVLAAALGSWPVLAEHGAPSCVAAMSGIQTFGGRARTLALFEQLPRHCLQALFLRCSRDAGERLLGLGDAAVCSIGYEALLSREFGGDFNALLAWWRIHRNDPIAD